MIVENIHVTDADSLDAAADLLELRESYGDYCARMADEIAADNVWTDDDISDLEWSMYNPDRNDGMFLLATVSPDTDPEPPSPAAPTLAIVTATDPDLCPACNGYGVHRMVPRTAHSGKRCWYCNGSGLDGDATTATTSDRTEHLRRIGQTGGMTTYERYGAHHMSVIGKTGYAITAARHGKQYARDLVRAKGWTQRKPELLSDLRAGRELADFDRAA
jgi:hypothetical protein